MEKLNMQTKDLTEENIKKITSLFPELITEVEREGRVIKTINADKLKELVGDYADSSEELYQLTWPGKQRSRQKIVTPISKTLRPVKEDSVDFEKTENLYIEGDNFEVLKLLQESYLNKVKAIYIDPPYNTGNNFVYKDDFKTSKDEYDEDSGAVDEEGNKLFKNTTTNGRFHSNWLSMMYERLVLAKDLLRDDGVIFISIDENENSNLKKILDEVFGEHNLLGEIIRKTKSTTNNAKKGFNIQHEYCLIYTKDKSEIVLKGELKTFDNYKNPDNDPKGNWTSSDPTATDDGRKTKNTMEIKNPYTGKIDKPGSGRRWRFNEQGFYNLVKEEKLVFKKTHGENERGFILKRYQEEVNNKNNLVPSLFVDNKYMNQSATKELTKLFNHKYFDYPKPVIFAQKILEYSTNKDDIILDFFSGSATTAHAVMQLNAEDDGNRKFIMVQLPEETDESSEAFKAGYKNICEIGKERIRRAGKKIKEETSADIDYGFKVFRIDELVNEIGGK